MALYDKKILYLDYLENGKKVKNAGFAKVEVRDGNCRILLNVKSTYDTDSLRTEVILLTDVGEIVTDHFMLNHGTGTYLVQLNPENMADKGISYEECLGVGVRLSENRIVQATWRELILPPEVYVKAEPESIPQPESAAEPEYVEESEPSVEPEYVEASGPTVESEYVEESEITVEPEYAEESEPAAESKVAEQSGTESEPKSYEEMEAAESKSSVVAVEAAKESKGMKEPEHNVKEKTAKNNTRKEGSQNSIIYDNKWKQLCQVYETVYPFHDERGYLSITPKDFIVLTKEFQPMVNNSFLLHGFYNYKHIILGREENGREEKYYIGVPGVYYDREKQVAVMFGFESFESETEPAPNGGFGYYMKRVEI